MCVTQKKKIFSYIFRILNILRDGIIMNKNF